MAFERRPAEPGLAWRLLGDLLEPVEDASTLGMDDDPRTFVKSLRAAGRLAGKTPLLVLDQFEDLMRPESAGARARLGLLLAATVERQPGSAGLTCRVVLAHLLRQAEAGSDGRAEIRVPEELEAEIVRALENHLRRALDAAFLGRPAAATREGRTRTLLALCDLADAEGKRGDSLPAGDLASTIGDGIEVLEALARRGAELIGEESRYEAMLTAVEIALPLPIDERLDDLETRGLLAWVIDYAVTHDPSLVPCGDTLRRQDRRRAIVRRERPA